MIQKAKLLWVGLLCAFHSMAQTTHVDLTNLQDANRVLENPHKGWFHHLWDEHSDRYPVSDAADAENFPGLQEMFIRIPWAELEPADNQYNWAIIDDAINRWAPKGFDFSFQIVCSSPYNLEYQYASPQWLENLGMSFIGPYDFGSGYIHYAPDYNSSVFQSKLLEFHQTFVDRYAGQPYFEHVEIGSYGDYGEGHTSFSNSQAYPLATVQALIDIYDIYPEGTVHVSEDYCVSNGRSGTEADILRDYIDAKGYSWRDNSVLVDYWLDALPADQYSVAEPDFFQSTYLDKPTFVEIEHYHLVKESNNWQGANGSLKGAAELRGAMSIIHPSYMSFHTFIPDWYADNPVLAEELANEIGYWYFLQSADLPVNIVPGTTMNFDLTWQNRGVAPAYNQYALKIKLEGDVTHYATLDDSQNRDWIDGEIETENYSISLPAAMPDGAYRLRVKLEDVLDTQRDVAIALDETLMDEEGYYEIGMVAVGVVNNYPPTARMTLEPASGTVPLSVAFDASTSTDPEGDPLTYDWDFGDGTSAQGISTAHTYTQTGSFEVTLTVHDGTSSHQTSKTVESQNTPPVASFVVNNQVGAPPMTVQVDASNSYDPNGHALSFAWDFGDASTATGTTATHTYTQEGHFVITLTVDDGQPKHHTDQHQVGIVSSFVPLLQGTIIGSTGSYENNGLTKEMAFDHDINTYFDGPQANDMWLGLDLGSPQLIDKFAVAPRAGWADRLIGAKIQVSSRANFKGGVTTIYEITSAPAEGEYTYYNLNHSGSIQFIRLLSPDAGYGNIAELEFYGPQSGGSNQPPVADVVASPTFGTAQLLVDFDASNSFDPDGDQLTYSWSFGDGTSGSGVTTSHQYAAEGVYTAILTVSDGSASDTASTTITVSSDGGSGGNLVQNFGFENGDFSSWMASGNVAVVGDNQQSGNYAARINAGGRVEQHIAVQPNTAYTIQVYSKKTGGTRAYVGIEGYGGSQEESIDGGNYLLSTWNVTTSSSASQLTIYGRCSKKTAYIDQWSVTQSSGARFGKNDESLDQIRVYPIPATSYVKLVWLGQKVEKVEIISLSGELVTSDILQSDDATLDVSHLPRGVFLLAAYTKDKISYHRLVLK